MGLLACIFGSLLAAIYLRKRGKGVAVSTALGALVAPVVVAFTSLVYPAEHEAQMWATIAIPVSYFWGLLAAGSGCGLVFLVRRTGRDA